MEQVSMKSSDVQILSKYFTAPVSACVQDHKNPSLLDQWIQKGESIVRQRFGKLDSRQSSPFCLWFM